MDSHAWPRAVLLDFYGTVVEEDDEAISIICNEIAGSSVPTATPSEVGSYWSQVFATLCYQSVGDTFRLQKELELISLQQVLGHFDCDLDAHVLSQVLYNYWRNPALFPESRAVLTQCGVPVCIVSNIDNAELASALCHCRLSFDFVVTSEDCNAYKPRGEVFERALTLLHLSAADVLHAGDSLGSDVRGARSAGIRTLWINRKNRSAPHGQAPDYSSNDLNGLLKVLQGDTEEALREGKPSSAG